MIWMCPTCILRPTKIIIKGAELKIKVCSVIKKRKKIKNKERKEKNNQNILTLFVISTNNLIMYMYASGYLKDDANPLTYFITWDENNNNNNKNNKKWTNKETSKIKQNDLIVL